MLWLATGILFAVFNAGTMLVSQKYKIEGVLMSGLRGVGVAAIYSPAAFFVPFPKSPEFWALIVLEGVLSSFFNSRLGRKVWRRHHIENKHACRSNRPCNVVDYNAKKVF